MATKYQQRTGPPPPRSESPSGAAPYGNTPSPAIVYPTRPQTLPYRGYRPSPLPPINEHGYAMYNDEKNSMKWKLKKGRTRNCGITLMFFGGLLVMSGFIMAFYIGATYSFGGYGLWGGSYIMLTGFYAIVTSKCPNSTNAGILMTLAFLCTLVALVVFALAARICVDFYMAIFDIFIDFAIIFTSFVLMVSTCRSYWKE